MDLALNNLQRLISHKTQQQQQFLSWMGLLFAYLQKKSAIEIKEIYNEWLFYDLLSIFFFYWFLLFLRWLIGW